MYEVWKRSRGWLFAGWLSLTLCAPLGAQGSWEFDPYEVQVWLVTGESPTVTPALLERVAAGMRGQAEMNLAAAWKMKVLPAPTNIADDLRLPDLSPSYERLKEADDAIGGNDKLFAVLVEEDQRGFVLAVREFDVRTRAWSLTLDRVGVQREQLPYAAWDLVQSAFTPLMRVEKIDGKLVVARLRAGGLIIDNENNPAALNAGDTLQPVLRRNDRSGEPMAVAGVQFVPWSVVYVKERAGGLVTADMHSGIRYPLPTRGGVRTERLCVKIKPRFDSTTITFVSKAKDAKPLEGYEVFTKSPDSEDAELLGKTDWQGQFEIKPNANPLQILYVRSAGKLLARLPLVAGMTTTADVKLADDQQRLQAEGLVAALQSRVTDLVARREIYAARIRIFIKKEKYDEALALVEEYRKLESRTELFRQLDLQQPTVRAGDSGTQARIDKSFADIRNLIGRFLDPRTADSLEADIKQAKLGPPPEPEPTPEPEPKPTPTPEPTPEPVPKFDPAANPESQGEPQAEPKSDVVEPAATNG